MSDNIIPFERLQRGKSKNHNCNCGNKAKYIIDPKNHVVECSVCGQSVEPFKVLMHIVDNNDELIKYRNNIINIIQNKEEEYNILKANPPRRVIAKKIEQKFLSKNRMYPKCPCCDEHFDLSEILNTGANSPIIEQKIKRRKKWWNPLFEG